MHMLQALQTLPFRQRGLTTVEYAIAGGLVAAAVIVAFIALGGKVGGIIQYISDQLVVPA